MDDATVLVLLGWVHRAYFRWPKGYRADHLANRRVQRINRMGGLPGRFRLDDHGHMFFHHADGRMLHPWTLAFYRAHGDGTALTFMDKPMDDDWWRQCRVFWP